MGILHCRQAGIWKETLNRKGRTMIKWIGIWVLLTISSSQAASPSYCHLYSQESGRVFFEGLDKVDQVTLSADSFKSIIEHYYWSCIVVDLDPLLPNTTVASEDFFIQSLLDRRRLQINTIEANITEDTSPPEVSIKPAVRTNDEASSPRVCGRSTRSGFALGSAQQKKWCRKNYKSYNATTGMVSCAHRKKDKCS